MVKCIIVGCTSGYKNNTDKVHQFSAPKDSKLRSEWQRCIPRKDFILKDNSYVCEKHFKEEDIIKYWESGPVKVAYTKWKLKEGTIPSIFPGPSYLSNLRKQRKLPAVRHAITPISKFSDENAEDFINNCSIEQGSCLIEDNLYHKLTNFQCSPWVKLPMTVENTDICFVIFIANSNSVPTVERSIQVNKQGKVSYAVNGKLIDITEQGIEVSENIEDFSNNIKKFESIRLCYGSPLANIFPNFPKDLCTKSNKGFLQHRQCLLTIQNCSKDIYCSKCKSLKNVLACREKRKALGSKEILDVSPSKKPRIIEIRKKAYALQRKVTIAKKKICDLQDKLSKSHKDMAEYNEQFIQDKLNGMNESQKAMVM